MVPGTLTTHSRQSQNIIKLQQQIRKKKKEKKKTNPDKTSFTNKYMKNPTVIKL